MATQISQSVVNALEKLVGERPYYVTMAEVEQDAYFIILGKKQFYFVDSSLRESTDDTADCFKYSWIQKIRCDRKRRNLLQLVILDEGRQTPYDKNVYT